MIAERDAFKAQCEADEKARNDFREAVATDKRRGVSKKSKYTASFPAQVQALVVRQFQLKAQDKVDLIVSWTTSIIVAIISGLAPHLLRDVSKPADQLLSHTPSLFVPSRHSQLRLPEHAADVGRCLYSRRRDLHCPLVQVSRAPL